MKNFGLALLLLTSAVSQTIFAQTSSTIRVTHTPGKVNLNGESVYNIPDWQPASTTNSCFSFLDIRVFYKAKSKTELQWKLEVTNNSSYDIWGIDCSSWAVTGYGQQGIKAGKTVSDVFDSKDPYPSITFKDVEFQFTKEVQKEYGVYPISKPVNCGETATSYLNKQKQANSNVNGSETGSSSRLANSATHALSENEETSISKNEYPYNPRADQTSSTQGNSSTSSAGIKSSSNDSRSDSVREPSTEYSQSVVSSTKQKNQENARRQQEYDRRIAAQTRKNQEIAAGATATSAGLIYVLGTLTYGKMGYANDLYSGRQLYFDVDFGYSITHIPMLFNSVEIRERNGTTFESSETKLSSSSTLNYDLKMSLGYEHEYGGGEGFGYGQAGFLPLLFDRWNVTYGGGFKLYGGYTWVKAFGSWSWGSRLNTKRPWILPEQLGSGKLNLNERSFSWGLRFSFIGLNENRNHIHIGFIREFLQTNETQGFRIYYPEQFSFGSTGFEDININGYMFEWQKEHYFKLYLNVFLDYPVGGISEFNLLNEPPVEQLHFELGFVRNLRIY